MSIPLSEQLKQATNPYHHRLDQLAVLKNLLSPQLSAEQYETAILYFYHCFSQWQPWLEEACQTIKPPHFALIDTHFSALREEVNRFDSHVIPSLTQSPQISSVETYLGYSYVLTGSQLGARFILKRLQQSALAHDYDFNYYTQLAQVGLDMTVWKGKLDQWVDEGGYDPQAIIDGAVQCFMQLTTWFEQAEAMPATAPQVVQ
jgi:heme oxygenase